jgi:hypothetical protein
VLGVKNLDDALVNKELLEEDDPQRFREARDGDHLVCPFQCDLCHFENMKRRLPTDGNLYNELCLICIQRVILDSLWAKERTMVKSNRLDESL